MTYEGLLHVRCILNVQVYIYINIPSIVICIKNIKNISDLTGDIKGQLKVSRICILLLLPLIYTCNEHVCTCT